MLRLTNLNSTFKLIKKINLNIQFKLFVFTKLFTFIQY